MDVTITNWLRTAGWSAFTMALGALFIIDGIAIAAFFAKRGRRLINAWTGPVVAINIVLVAIGAGVPLVTSVARLAIIGARGVLPAAIFDQNTGGDAPIAEGNPAD